MRVLLRRARVMVTKCIVLFGDGGFGVVVGKGLGLVVAVLVDEVGQQGNLRRCVLGDM